MSGKFEFDQASVDALKPGEKEWVAWDEGLAGFGVRILPSGMKSWIVSARTRQEDGKVRRRRIRIARCTDMNLEEARTAARKVLSEAVGDGGEEAAVESLPAEGVDKPASQDGDQALEDRAADPPPNDAGMEEAPGAGAEPGAVSVTPSGDRYDTKTGEILPASDVDGRESHDDDLDLGNSEVAAEAAREPEADGEAAGADQDLMHGIVDDTIAGVRDSPHQDTPDLEPLVSEATARPSESVEGPSAIRRGGDGEESASDDRRQGRDVPGVRKPEAREEGGRQPESGGPPGAEEAGAERPKRSRIANMTKDAVHTVGKAAGKIAGIARKGAAETPAGAGKPAGEPEAARPADGPAEEKADQEEVAEAAAQLGQKTEDAEASGEKTRAARDMSDETAAAFAKNLDLMREQLDQVATVTGALGPRLDTLTTALSVSTRDFRQRKRRWIRPVLAAALAAPVIFAGGAALQSRLEVLPQADPTLGWKDHLWQHYGAAFRDCFQQAKQAESGYADCTIKVRGR